MAAPNLFTAVCQYDDADPPGYRSGMGRVGEAAGGQELTTKLFEVAPGESICPYHYEYVEEWLLVLTGEVELRSPSGTEALTAGALVCFPAGPEGGHKVTNPTAEPVRVLMWSSAREPSVAVYPDSDKIGVWPGRDEDRLMLRRADGRVDYYDGET